MSTMTDEFREQQRQALLQREKEIQENFEQQRSEYEELSQANRIEPVDEAQVRLESHNRGALRFRDEEQLTRIRSALQRIEDDKYGICAGCGTEIAHERLLAKPEAVFCIECERRHEKQ